MPRSSLQPPRWADRLLAWFCHPQHLEALQGDLWELFYHRAGSSPRAARRRYAWAVLRAFRPSLWKWGAHSFANNTIAMLSHYFIMFWRQLRRRPTEGGINIAGLFLAFTSLLLIGLYVHQQLTYDTHHTKTNRLYRVIDYAWWGNGETPEVGDQVSELLHEEIHQAIAGIEAGTPYRSYGWQNKVLQGNKAFYDLNITLVSGDFFRMFDMPFAQGNPTTALVQPQTAVLNHETAVKLFADPAQALGQRITIQASDTIEVLISGVLAPQTNPSIVSNEIYLNWYSVKHPHANWNSIGGKYYVLLKAGADTAAVSAAIEATIAPHWHEPDERWYCHGLQPLAHVHLDKGNLGAPTQGRMVYVQVFSVLALFIVLLAIINYTNLTTASFAIRYKEMGVRKALGAARRQLAWQVMSESLTLSMLVGILALGGVSLLLPTFNRYFSTNLHISKLFTAPLIYAYPMAVLVVGLVAGLYPALYFARYRPVQLLKAGFSLQQGNKIGLRQLLVGLQFAVAGFLVLGTLVIYSQMRYTSEKDLGYNRENILYMRLPSEETFSREAFRQELLQLPGVQQVAYCTFPLGLRGNSNGLMLAGETEYTGKTAITRYIEPEFQHIIDLQLVQGRLFSDDIATDTTKALLVNEAFVRTFKLEEPIGYELTINGHEVAIIGVFKDIHVENLHNPIMPLALINRNLEHAPFWQYTTITIKMAPGNPTPTLEAMEAIWLKKFTSRPFNFVWQDEYIQRTYAADTQFQRVFTFFTTLTLIIALLGLFSLASFVVKRRLKEVAVRKVLGASPRGLLVLLNRDFLLIVAVSLIVALPLGYYAMNEWLADFSYRISIGPLLLAAPVLLSLGLSALVVSYHSLRAANQNPAAILKYE